MVAEMADDATCDECGAPALRHPITPRQDECGWYAAMPCDCKEPPFPAVLVHKATCGGGPCVLPVGHAGAHTLVRPT